MNKSLSIESPQIISPSPSIFPLTKKTPLSSPSESQTQTLTSYIPQFSKNFVIIILLVLLILALLGINIFLLLGSFIQGFVLPLLMRLWSLIAYSLGFTIDRTSEITASAAKTGIDIADGVFDNIGNLLMASSQISGIEDKPKEIKVSDIIEKPREIKTPEIKPDEPDSSIQRPEKTSWCYIGSHNGTRGCAEIGQNDKCMSGMIYESQGLCLSTRK